VSDLRPFTGPASNFAALSRCATGVPMHVTGGEIAAVAVVIAFVLGCLVRNWHLSWEAREAERKRGAGDR
jgi:hypothetical protein